MTELDPADAQLTTLATTGRTFVESVDDLTGVRAGDVRTLPGYPDPDAYQMPGESEDAAITISGGQAVESQTTRIYDADAGTITDVAQDPPVVYRERDGFFVADGDPPTQLSPGFTTDVGFDNFEEVFTSSEFRGPFFRVLAWNLVFALLSVVVTFALGLLLAVVFNDVRMRGRKVYRSLIIIPYALPGVHDRPGVEGACSTRRSGSTSGCPSTCRGSPRRSWRCSSLILVNMWLGYPYMFLVSTGALQSVPADLKEAAYVDGATGWKAFRKITFPLLLVSVSPLLVASFAFNFNNFTLVYLLTGGIPAQDAVRAPGRRTS